MARHFRSLILAALVSALLAVQPASMQLQAVQAADLLPPELAGLSAEQLQAIVPDPDCTAANPVHALFRKQTACADCTTVKACIYAGATIGWVAGKNTSCSGWTPWCNDGVCSATLSPTQNIQNCNSPKVDDTFQCPPTIAYSSSRYWPNLSSCSKYWICTSAGAYAGDCSPYAVYDQRTSLCVPEGQAPCTPISCLNAPAYQVLPSAPWIYAVCTSDDVADALMFACENPVQRYNGTNCVNACNRAGRFPLYYPDSYLLRQRDETAYYECVAHGNQLIGPNVGKCPPGLSFNTNSLSCQ